MDFSLGPGSNPPTSPSQAVPSSLPAASRVLTLSLATVKQVPTTLLSDEDDSDLLKARTPLMTAKKLRQDFSRVLKERRRKGASEPTDVEEVSEEGAVAPLMTALYSEQSPLLRESPGKLFSNPISPMSKASKSPSSSSRRPEERSQVLQEMAKSIYSNFFQERRTMHIEREEGGKAALQSRSFTPAPSIIPKPSSPTSLFTTLPKSSTSSPAFSRACSPPAIFHHVPPVSPSLPAKVEFATAETNTDLLNISQLESTLVSLKSEVARKAEELEANRSRAELAESCLFALKRQIEEMEESRKIKEREVLEARKEAGERGKKEQEMKTIIRSLESKVEAVAKENQSLQQELRSLTSSLTQANLQRAKDSQLLAVYLQERQTQRSSTPTPFRTTNRVMSSAPRNPKPTSSPVSDLENTSDTLHQPLFCPQPIQEPERYYSCDSVAASLEYCRLVKEQGKLQKALQAIPPGSRSLANKRRKLALEFELSVIAENIEALRREDSRSDM